MKRDRLFFPHPKLLLVTLFAVFSGCTVYKVNPIPYNSSFKTAYVVRNAAVRTKGFEELLLEQFNNAGIKTKVVLSARDIPYEAYWVAYTGLWSWDMLLFLSHAEVKVFKGTKLIGTGYYHHRGEDLSLAWTKFKSARAKMIPLYDELLENYILRRKAKNSSK